MGRIADNLEKIRERIKKVAARNGREEKAVQLVVVTKHRGRNEILQLKDLGITTIGENRLQELSQKFDYLEKKFDIHLIGHLQTNKVKKAVDMVQMIESVDSVKVAQAIDRACAAKEKKMPVLIQVNTSFEENKRGVSPEHLIEVLKNVSGLKHIQVQGLMTMAMLTEDPEKARKCFQVLAMAKKEAEGAGIDNITLKHLSMGMSNDYETAIEEGASMVRIGAAIFSGSHS